MKKDNRRECVGFSEVLLVNSLFQIIETNDKWQVAKHCENANLAFYQLDLDLKILERAAQGNKYVLELIRTLSSSGLRYDEVWEWLDIPEPSHHREL